MAEFIKVDALGDACPLPANWRRKHRQCCTERPMDVSSKNNGSDLRLQIRAVVPCRAVCVASAAM